MASFDRELLLLAQGISTHRNSLRKTDAGARDCTRRSALILPDVSTTIRFMFSIERSAYLERKAADYLVLRTCQRSVGS